MISHIHGFRFLVHSSVTDAQLTQTASRFFGLPVTYADLTVVSRVGAFTVLDIVPMPGEPTVECVAWSAEDVADGTLRLASVTGERRASGRKPFVSSLLASLAALVAL